MSFASGSSYELDTELIKLEQASTLPPRSISKLSYHLQSTFIIVFAYIYLRASQDPSKIGSSNYSSSRPSSYFVLWNYHSADGFFLLSISKFRYWFRSDVTM